MVKTALPMPIALIIPAAAMMTEVKFVGVIQIQREQILSSKRVEFDDCV